MSDFPRYAIYYAPAAHSALARFGAEMLGYDASSGSDVPHRADVVDAAPDWHDLAGDPRKYGFHATLKAPFALVNGATETELLDACANFAKVPCDIPVIAPVVRAISGFTAIVPAEPSSELAALAQDCVEAFDPFRAPMTAADRARRRPGALTARQVAQLDRWGYPYVRDDFRFHMTLTGRLPAARQPEVIALLDRHFAALELATLAIDRIALFKQDTAASRFRIIAEFTLREKDVTR